MNKKLIIISGIITLLGILLVIVVLPSSKNTPQQNGGFPTPTSASNPSVSKTSGPLKIISLSPPDGSTNNSLRTTIVITFNQKVPENISFFSFPDFPHISSDSGEKLIITPTSDLSTNIIYTYTISDLSNGSIMKKATFATGESPIEPLTGRYEDLDTIADKAQRETYPDVYLANFTPYSAGDFSASSYFVSKPPAHYAFVISLLGSNKDLAKQHALSWLGSLELTQDNIKKLDIAFE